MDMFNKFKNTVSGVIPVGNPVTREFEVKNQCASGGPGLLWKIYEGCNRNTKQEASVFIFEKKALERYSKHDRELIMGMLKRGVTQLTKLRHPNILSVLHPLEDSRESLAFATEPVFLSLANALGQHENMPNPLPPDLEGFKLYDVEIKYGLVQLCEGLAFLHNSVKLVHGNVCPQAVMINKVGAWKIAGFDFCIPNSNSGDQLPYFPHREWRTDIPPLVQQQLNYLAPEYALTMACDTSSDMFSVGILFYALFNFGKTVFDARDQWSTYKGNVESLRRLKLSVLGSVPEEVRESIGLLLNTEPSVRPDADQLTKIPFFEDVGAMTLQYLDTLFQRDNLQKSQFFKGLPKVLEKMPKRVNQQRILPSLFSECVNRDMIPFVLPCILLIAESSTEKEYIQHVLPGLIPLFRMKDPIQILLIFMENMTLLLKKTPQSDIKTHVLPMVYGALDSKSPQIQDLCLNIIPTFANLIDFTSMKNSLIPRIKRLCLCTSLLNIRVMCLICIGKLLEYMDKWYVLDDILPIMKEIPSREPAVLMAMLGIYKVVMTHQKLGITKDVLANNVIPFLFPVAIDHNLNLQQFTAYMTVLKEMIDKVESEHRAKLEQLASMQTEQRTIQITSAMNQADSKNKAASANASEDSTMMDKFMSGFGLTSYFNSESAAKKSNDISSAKDVTSSASNGNAFASITHSKPESNKLPNQPAKVSLTLEEKKRLAKQQEQQTLYKSQPPLHSTYDKNSSRQSSNDKNSQVKDLTSTLMSSNLMNNSTSTFNSSTKSINNTSSVKPNYSIGSSGMGSTEKGGMTNTASSQNASGWNSSLSSNVGSSPGMNSASKNSMHLNSKVDVSSFDSLLSGQNNAKKVSLNQMTQKSTTNNYNNMLPSGTTNTYNMSSSMTATHQSQQSMPFGGNAAFGGSMPFSSQQGFMGNPGMIGGNPSMMGANPGMMGANPGMMGGNQSMKVTSSQGFTGQTSADSKLLSKSEIDDLLG